MGETRSVDNFSGKLNSVVNEIHSLGDKLEESVAVKKYLRVMPEKFLPIVTTLMYSDNLPKMKIEEVMGALKAHEELLKGFQVHHEHALLLNGDAKSNRRQGCRELASVPGGRGSPQARTQSWPRAR